MGLAQYKLLSISGVTDSNGDVEVSFAVSLFAGDNYKVVASDNQQYLQTNLVVQGEDITETNGGALTQGAVSDMLTVWRREHIEVDSMGVVRNNHVDGKVKDFKDADKKEPCTNCSAITIDMLKRPKPGLDDALFLQSFENGKLSIKDIGDFKIIGKPQVTQGDFLITPAIDKRRQKDVKDKLCTIFDDDDFNNNDQSNLKGDETEQITALNSAMIDTFGLMQDSDDPAKNVFAAAFVQPDYEWAKINNFNDNNLPFDLNSSDNGTTLNNELLKSLSRQSQAFLNPFFWVVYIKLAYQPTDIEDKDPTYDLRSTVGGTAGVSPGAHHGSNRTTRNVFY